MVASFKNNIKKSYVFYENSGNWGPGGGKTLNMYEEKRLVAAAHAISWGEAVGWNYYSKAVLI